MNKQSVWWREQAQLSNDAIVDLYADAVNEGLLVPDGFTFCTWNIQNMAEALEGAGVIVRGQAMSISYPYLQVALEENADYGDVLWYVDLLETLKRKECLQPVHYEVITQLTMSVRTRIMAAVTVEYERRKKQSY